MLVISWIKFLLLVDMLVGKKTCSVLFTNNCKLTTNAELWLRASLDLKTFVKISLNVSEN